jgi:hypothetical protein
VKAKTCMLVAILALAFALPGCQERSTTELTADEARAIADEAYIYAYPMLMARLTRTSDSICVQSR